MDDRLTRARSPTTPPEELRRLMCDGASHEVREAIASNPNAPVGVLLALAAEHPRAFVSNAALPLLRLEQIDLLKSLPEGAVEAILRRGEPDEELVRALTDRAYFSDTLTAALLACRATPTDMLDRLLRPFAPTAQEVWLDLASHPNASAGALQQCAEHEAPAVRALAARHPRAPAAALDDLRRAGASDDLTAIVHPGDGVSEGDLVALSSRGPFAQHLVASHPRSPVEALRNLVMPPLHVRLKMIAHPHITPELLDGLVHAYNERESPRLRTSIRRAKGEPQHAQDHDDDTHPARCAVATHPLVLRSTLERLANDRSPAVRAAAAKHPAIAPRSLTSLGLDEHPDVVRAALGNPALSAEAIAVIVRNNPPGPLALQAALHPATDRLSLRALAQHADKGVRAAALARLAGASAPPPEPPSPAAASPAAASPAAASPAASPRPEGEAAGPLAWARALLRRLRG